VCERHGGRVVRLDERGVARQSPARRNAYGLDMIRLVTSYCYVWSVLV